MMVCLSQLQTSWPRKFQRISRYVAKSMVVDLRLNEAVAPSQARGDDCWSACSQSQTRYLEGDASQHIRSICCLPRSALARSHVCPLRDLELEWILTADSPLSRPG